MDFFNEIGKKITDAGQKTIKKTRDMTDTIKYNSMISDEEKTIKTCYLKIGELYYKKFAVQADEEFKSLVDQITDAENKIEEYRKAIEELKDTARCPKCGATINADDSFCVVCGASIKTEISSGNSDASSLCPKCGATVADDAAFCDKCGTKIV